MALSSVVLFVALQPRTAAAQLSTTDPVNLFTNLSSRFLQAEFGLSLNQIQVYPTNQYTPTVHRLLQVAANLWEATTDSTNGLPTVFRPRFSVTNGLVYISNYVLVTNSSELDGLPLLDLAAASNASGLIPPSGDALVYSVPLVIGARKGLPNFNEFQAEPFFTITRKIELVKPSASSTVVSQTNQFFTMALTMAVAAEFWNSYLTDYTRSVTVCITNHCSISLTNDLGVNYSAAFISGDAFSTNVWPRVNTRSNFMVLMRTNIPFLPTVKYRPDVGFQSTNAIGFDESQGLIMPRWGMTISNRVHGLILDQVTGKIIDYVLLGNMVCYTNLTDVFSATGAWSDDGDTDSTSQAFKNLWSTNQLGAVLGGRPGIIQQIRIARAEQAGLDSNIIISKWKSYGEKPAGFSTVSAAISFFNTFLSSSSPTNRTLVPFSPAYQFSIPMLWQANDPLVHYMAEDLLNSPRSYQVVKFDPQSPNPRVPLDNIGRLNDRYLPWGGNPYYAIDNDPDAYNPALKDPGVTSSDMWNFPTNTLPSIDWLGRVHRGTPWQTLYLKSSDMGLTNQIYSLAGWMSYQGDQTASARWSRWTGNADLEEGFYTRSVRDWSLVALLQSLLNTNAPQHLLSVNDRNPDNWQAVLDGMTVLTNTGTFSPQFTTLTVTSNSPQATMLTQAIAITRRSLPGGVFRSLGDLLATPALADASPYLNLTPGSSALQRGMTDEAYEKIPSQLLSLVRADSIGEVRVSGTTPQIKFTGFDGYPYAIEGSSNLVNWIPVSTNYPANGIFEFAIPFTTSTNAFYRSVLLP